MADFSTEDYWKASILYGLNQATFKIALGKSLLSLASEGNTKISWETLSKGFFLQYQKRLTKDNPMPQQATICVLQIR